MKKHFVLVFLFAMFSLGIFAQQEVQIGEYRFVPEQNMKKLVNSKSGIAQEALAQDNYHVLVQFSKIPTLQERSALQQNGVNLGSYLKGNAYYATISKGASLQKLSELNLNSIVPIRSEWKTDSRILKADVPDYAKSGNDIKAVLYYSKSVSKSFVENYLAANNYSNVVVSEAFNEIRLDLPTDKVKELAKTPWIEMLTLIEMPKSLFNTPGRTMTQGNLLTTPPALNGRGLSGKGVKVGVWDGDVESHVDYGNRIHQQEFELSVKVSQGHGMHVSGTVAGAGVLDPDARGNAPKAELYTYNFNMQSNGLNAQEEMRDAREQFGINQTQNSYGVNLDRICDYYDRIAYNSFTGDMNLDQLVNYFPTLTHVFAAGNNQGDCGRTYGTSASRTKNVIFVGAADQTEKITTFSSFGPMDDGRLIPHVTAFGRDVYSTVANNKYEKMSGTSMACPNVSGIVALIIERYKQLNNNNEPLASLVKALVANTAKDKGRKNLDFEYGYGIVNAEKAVQSIENKWFIVDEISNGEAAKEYTITVPKGVKQLRVMLVWSDTVARKNYVYGEPALINNLDLEVENGGTTTYPWVLDPKNPKAVATRGVDNINNIEQVTIDDPSQGNYTVKVKATEVVNSKQEYSVVYFFEKPEFRLTYPNGGELLTPGESIVMHTEYSEAPIDVEISYDNGTTFLPLVKGLEEVAILNIPKDAPLAAKALLRVSSGKMIDISDAPFTIMPAPQNLQVELPDCGTEGWKLIWDKIKDVTKYEVLKADVDEGTFSSIGIVTNDTVFTIPKIAITNDKRNVFSVRVKTDDGVGKRAKGVLVNTSQPIVINAAKLPFSETFVEYPSKYLKVTADESIMKIVYLPNRRGIGAKPGDHFLALSTTNRDYNWNIDDPFDSKNKATLSICNLDLSDFNANSADKIHFSMHTQFTESTPKAAQFKIEINGKRVKDLAGDTVFFRKESFYKKITIDLTPYKGQNPKIDMIFVAKTERDFMIINNLDIYLAKDEKDVELFTLKTAFSGLNLSDKEEVEILVQNNGIETIENIPVAYQINDNPPVFENIAKKIKPNEQHRYNFYKKLDLTTQKTLGEKFNLKVMSAYSQDANRKNDTLKRTIVNLGKVFPLARTTVVRGIMGPVLSDPRETKIVGKDSIIFTDMGGALLPYDNMQESTVCFVPEDNTKAVQVVFKSFDVEKYDPLEVYNKNVRPTLNDLGAPTEILRGKIEKDYTIIGQASDGSITFKFKADNTEVKDGWVAIVKQVEKENRLSLASLKLEKFYGNKQITLPIKVSNKTSEDMQKVKVAYQINGGDAVVEYIPEIKAGKEVKYNFNKKIDFHIGKVYYILVRILAPDADGKDNVQSFKLINDKYCYNTIRDNAKIFIEALTMDGKKIVFEDGAKEEIDYHLSDTLVAYKDIPNVLKVKLPKGIDPAVLGGSRIVAWVDWNNNFTFESAEKTKEMSISSDLNYDYQIKAPTDAIVGPKRMRIAILGSNQTRPCNGNYDYGHIIDLMLDVKEKYTIKNDLALTNITLKKGKDLTNQETVKVKIRNNGSQEISNFSIAYKVAENAEVSESVSRSIRTFEEIEYVFNTKADFAGRGKHDVKVYLKNNDENQKNDTIKGAAYNVKPHTEGYFALDMKAGQKPVEYVNAGTLNGAAPSTFTYEAWIKPQREGRNTIFDYKGVYVIIFEGSKEVKKNALATIVGKKQVNHTSEAVIKQGRWQHIAITGKRGINWFNEHYTELKIMINGEEVESEIQNADYVKGVENSILAIAPDFNGMIDEVRLWEVARTPEQIKEGMYKHFRQTDGTLPQGLLVEFSFDEGENNSATLSGDNLAVIRTKRAAAGSNSIWQKPNQLMYGTMFDQQVAPATKTGENEWTVVIQKDADLSKVTGKLIDAWDNTVFTIDGEAVKENTVFNFSGAQNKIAFKANAPHKFFGKDLSQDFTIIAKQDKSSEADLLTLSFTKANNSGLANDVNITPVGQNMSADLTKITDLSTAVPTFTASAKAKVTYLGNPLVSGTTQIDLTQPVVITVEAENGRYSKNYVLYSAKTQSITWSFTPGAYKYGQGAVQLNATASSSLPVRYVSDNNSVASVNAAGELLFSGVGMANITAMQDGGNGFVAATPVTKQIAVGKADLTAKIQDLSIKHTEALPTKVTWNFATLVAPEDEAEIRLPAFEIQSAGSPALPATGYLTAGTYDLAPKQTSLATPHYSVTFQKGSLTVGTNSHTKNAVFAVTDGANAVEGATIKINGTQFTTDVSGNATVALIDSATFAYEVSKTGYETVKGKVVMARANQDVAVSIGKADITLTYTAQEGGILVGESSQKVAKGGTGTAINAAPSRGYFFLKWDDENTDNPRIDKNVTKNIEASAIFKKTEILVKYIAEAGGKIEGNKEQTLVGGNTSEKVKAVADEGYYFARWSDGNRNPERSDTPDNPATYKAIFFQYIDLPFTEDFENGIYYWMNEDKEGGRALWEVRSGNTTLVGREYNLGTGNFVFFNSDAYGKRNFDIYLTSRRLNIDKNAKSIKIEFDYRNESNYAASFFVHYTTDGGKTDIALDTVKGSRATARGEFELFIDSLPAEAKHIAFAWRYKDRWNYATSFDNIKIQNAYSVIFNVTKEEQGIAGATVVINSDTLTTDKNGKANITLVDGEYDYKVSKEGMSEKTGKVTVNKAEQIVNVSYTGINDELGRGIAIYPNPFSERLLIKGTQAVETVIFSTLSGQVVKIIENTSNENQLDINLSELNSGTYLLQLRTASGTVKVQKVVKE